jgi:hypothetical protein
MWWKYYRSESIIVQTAVVVVVVLGKGMYKIQAQGTDVVWSLKCMSQVILTCCSTINLGGQMRGKDRERREKEEEGKWFCIFSFSFIGYQL